MTMITPSYLGETIEYSSLHACRSTLEDPTGKPVFDQNRDFIGYRGTATDETAMVEARRRAEAAEVLVRRVFETSQDLILVTDSEGTFIRVSPSAMSVLGYDPGEMVGRDAAEFIYSEDLDNTRNEMRTARRAGITQNFECRYLHKEGRLVTLWWTGAWSAPEAQHFFIGRDITERKESERRLRDSAEQLRRAQRLGRMGSNSTDLRNGAIEWSDETYRIFGVSRETFVPSVSTILDRVHPDDRDLILSRMKRTRKRIAPEPIEYRIVHDDGTVRHVYRESEIIKAEHDNPDRLISIILDITERKRAEVNLRRSEERFRSIFSAVSEGIFIVSPTGTFSEVNEAGCALFGYTSGELIGGDIQMISSGEPPYAQRDVMEWHQKAMASGGPQTFEWHCKAKDGHLFWAEVSIRFASISGQDVVLATVRDMTARIAVEAQLRQAQKMEAIGNLTGGMAHDFNNLLGIIIGNLDLLRDQQSGGPDADELRGEALDAALRGAGLTRRLLAFARLQPLQPALHRCQSSDCRDRQALGTHARRGHPDHS